MKHQLPSAIGAHGAGAIGAGERLVRSARPNRLGRARAGGGRGGGGGEAEEGEGVKN